VRHAHHNDSLHARCDRQQSEVVLRLAIIDYIFGLVAKHVQAKVDRRNEKDLFIGAL
jgi:hypothetical protein